MKGILKIEIKVSTEQAAQNFGKVLQNIADTVSETEIKDVAELLKTKPKMFSNLVKKINNPILKNFI